MKEMEKRLYQSMSENGLLEMSVGLYLLILGLMFIGQPKLVSFSALFIFVLKPLVLRIQNQYIHPRIGYVKLRETDSSVGKGIGITAIVFVLILVGSLIALNAALGSTSGRAIWFRWFLPILSSIMFSFGPYWLGRTYGLKRGYFMAIFIPFVGILVAVLGRSTGYTSVGIVFLSGAIPAIASGLIMFRLFLKKHPILEVQNEEE